MLKLIQSVLLVLFEIICCKFFYEKFGKVRYKGWINIVQLTLLLGSILFLSCSFFEYFLMRQFFGIFLFSVFMLWHVQISFKKSLVLAILFDALLLAVDYLIYLGSKLFGRQHEVGYIWTYLLAKIILFFSYSHHKKMVWEKNNGNDVGQRMVKVFVLSYIYHSNNFCNDVCF